MTHLERTVKRTVRGLRGMATELSVSRKKELADLANQLADDLDDALRDPDVEEDTGPAIELGDSESSQTTSSKDIREELARVSERMRNMKENLQNDD